MCKSEFVLQKRNWKQLIQEKWCWQVSVFSPEYKLNWCWVHLKIPVQYFLHYKNSQNKCLTMNLHAKEYALISFVFLLTYIIPKGKSTLASNQHQIIANQNDLHLFWTRVCKQSKQIDDMSLSCMSMWMIWFPIWNSCFRIRFIATSTCSLSLQQ